MIRRKARELALRMLYQKETNEEDTQIALTHYLEIFPYQKEVTEYAKKILSGIRTHEDSIDNLINEASEHWKFERISVIDRNILRIGVYELCFSEDVPPKVAIDEAISLSKKYGNEDSYKFVNGILDRIFKEFYSKKGERADEGR